MSCCVHVLTCPHLPQDGFQWVFLDLNLVLTLDRHSFCFQVKDFSFFFFSCLLLFGFITSRRCFMDFPWTSPVNCVGSVSWKKTFTEVSLFRFWIWAFWLGRLIYDSASKQSSPRTLTLVTHDESPCDTRWAEFDIFASWLWRQRLNLLLKVNNTHGSSCRLSSR